MFVLLIVIVAAYLVGNILGKAMPQVSEWALGALVGLVVSYLLIYDNVYVWGSLVGNRSAAVVEQTRMTITIIGFVAVMVITALGAKKARKAAPSKAKKKD